MIWRCGKTAVAFWTGQAWFIKDTNNFIGVTVDYGAKRKLSFFLDAKR